MTVRQVSNGGLASFFAWFGRAGYFQGVFWITLVCLISNINDILMRLAGHRLPSFEIAFFRFFFALVVLIPFMITAGRNRFYTNKAGFHILRGILGFGAVAFWVAGVVRVPLTVASTMSFTVPVFTLPLAVFFLKEHVGWERTCATVLGFLGIMVIIYGTSGVSDFWASLSNKNDGTLFLIAAAILFASSDILNKKMVVKESPLTMLFYFALGTTVLGAIPAYMVWQNPTLSELAYLFLLGVGGNLILYFLLKAFSATDVSALAPYRYVELLFSGFFGYILFSEVPKIMTLAGAAIIIPSTFALAYYESRLERSKAKTGKPHARKKASH